MLNCLSPPIFNDAAQGNSSHDPNSTLKINSTQLALLSAEKNQTQYTWNSSAEEAVMNENLRVIVKEKGDEKLDEQTDFEVENNYQMLIDKRQPILIPTGPSNVRIINSNK